MDKIGLWCKTVSAISVFSAVINLIVPASKLRNSFKTFTAIILIYSVFMPILESDFNLDKVFSLSENISESEDYESYEYYAVLKAAEISGKEITEIILSEFNISGECDVKCERVSDDSVKYEIRLKTDISQENRNEIIKRIKSNFGEETKVIFSEEE